MNTRDYRIFVGAFPEGALARRIQDLRLRHDPATARITPPHVTLAGTYWRSGPATPENEAHTVSALAALNGQIASFDLVLGGIAVFAGTNVLYLQVALTEDLIVARRALLQVLGPDKHGERFTPHLTLVMRLPPAASQALINELRQTAWHSERQRSTITRLQFMQRGPRDPAWRCIYRLPLTATAS